MNDTSVHWDAIYNKALLSDCDPIHCAEILTDNAFLLPSKGLALDLASGMGANATFLAHQGLTVTALDISKTATDKLNSYAMLQGLNIKACTLNIDINTFTNCTFDIIVVSRFLDRRLSDAIIGALKPNGLLFYQTFTKEKTKPTPPNNPDYLLNRNELLTLFSSLKIILYRENSLVGNPDLGLRNQAQFIGQKI